MVNLAHMKTLTIQCKKCGQESFLMVDENKWLSWQNGELIQTVFPELSLADRELMISHICPDCWNIIFKED